MFIIYTIPDVNGRPKHDNPFGKAKEKDVHFTCLSRHDNPFGRTKEKDVHFNFTIKCIVFTKLHFIGKCNVSIKLHNRNTNN
jgi:hypothetical protein